MLTIALGTVVFSYSAEHTVGANDSIFLPCWDQKGFSLWRPPSQLTDGSPGAQEKETTEAGESRAGPGGGPVGSARLWLNDSWEPVFALR